MYLIIMMCTLYILFITLFALSIVVCSKILIKYDKIIKMNK